MRRFHSNFLSANRFSIAFSPFRMKYDPKENMNFHTSPQTDSCFDVTFKCSHQSLVPLLVLGNRYKNRCLCHVSVSDLYIPRVNLPSLLQENMWTDPVNTVYQSLIDT
jgi:hypothetical protein